MSGDHRIVPAIKQALSMLRQAREALLFAQCATVAKSSPVAPSGAHPMAWLPVSLAAHGKR